MIYHANIIQKKAEVAILISYKGEKGIFRDKEGHYTMINGSVL